jgi:type II secretory pathway component PulF
MPWKSAPWYRVLPSGESRLALLQVLASAHETCQPLVPLLHAFANEQRGIVRRKVLELSQLIESGVGLIPAFEQTESILTREQILVLRFASQSGVLPIAYQDLVTRERELDETRDKRFDKHRWYWIFAAMGIFVVSVFVFTFIVPVFERTNREFGYKGDLGLNSLIAFRAWITSYWFLVLLLVVSAAVVIGLSSVRRRLRKLEISLAGSHSPVTMELLALAIQSGRPIAGAISTLAKYHFESGARGKLLIARNEIEQGCDPWDGLCTVGLITSAQKEGIGQAADGGVQAMILRGIATKQRLLESKSLAVFLTLREPLVLILLGLPVLWICYSMFQTLTSLIARLS